MNGELIAILDGRETGRVARDGRGRLSFTYNEAWRNAADAYPLSISMPLALAEHGNAKIDPFLWGLLPDNEMVLDHWARRFHVSARNAFGLIASCRRGLRWRGSVRPAGEARSHPRTGPARDRVARRGRHCAALARVAAKTTRPGASRATPASSVLPVRSRKPRSSLKTADGACLRAACPPRTFSSLRQASSTATPRTSISVWSWRALSGCPSRTPESCVFRTRSPSSSNATTASAQPPVSGASIRRICVRPSAFLRLANTKMKADPEFATSSTC